MRRRTHDYTEGELVGTRIAIVWYTLYVMHGYRHVIV
jgi:hypothetical protein